MQGLCYLRRLPVNWVESYCLHFNQQFGILLDRRKRVVSSDIVWLTYRMEL